jgi:hypothetical protein
MTRRVPGCLVALALSFAPAASFANPTPAPGNAIYETVDAVQVSPTRIVITGIIVGQSTQSEFIYVINNDFSTTTSEVASRCDRLALLAMAKPGKYQFAMVTPLSGSFFSCKLIVRTP